MNVYVLCHTGFKSKDGVPQMVKAYLDKKVMLDEFITHTMSLNQVNEAIELMKHGKWWIFFGYNRNYMLTLNILIF